MRSPSPSPTACQSPRTDNNENAIYTVNRTLPMSGVLGSVRAERSLRAQEGTSRQRQNPSGPMSAGVRGVLVMPCLVAPVPATSARGRGGTVRAGKDAAQALGLRPWLAALPLRERRLRARLLMCAPNGGLSVTRTGPRSSLVCHIIWIGAVTWGSLRGRPDQKADRFSRHGMTRHQASRVVLRGKSTQMDTS